MIKNNKKFMMLACLVFFLSMDQCLGRWAESLDDLQDGTEVAFFSVINQNNPSFEYMNNDYTRDITYYGNILLGPDAGCPYTGARWKLQKQGDGSFLVVTPNQDAAPYFYLFNENPNRITVSYIPGVQGTYWVFEQISDDIFALKSNGAYTEPSDSVYAEGRTNGIIGSSPNVGLAYPGTLWKIRLLTPLAAQSALKSSLNVAAAAAVVDNGGPLSPQQGQ